jgi:hypothetical protein
MKQVMVETVSDRETYRLVDQRAAAAAATALQRAGGPPSDFESCVPAWIRELREIASLWPDSGACTVATAMKLWLWTAKHFAGNAPVIDELNDAFTPLFAARVFVHEAILDDEARRDLSHVFCAHASAVAATTCAELVFGYRQHLTWDAVECASCFAADDLDDLEAFIPGIAAGARGNTDVIESDGSHVAKRGPCANFNGLDAFLRLRNRVDACLSGARIAKDRAAAAIARS